MLDCPTTRLLPVALFALVSLSRCAAPDSAVSSDAGSGQIAGENLTLDWQINAGDTAVSVRWKTPPGLSNALVHYRVGMPGFPWDGDEAEAGKSPVTPEQEGELTLTGFPNNHVVYVSLSFDDESGNRLFSPARFVIPLREPGAQVWVDSGVFTMGSSPGLADVDEEPAHAVFVDGFWMDRYVATNNEFRECVEAGACGPPAQNWGYLSYLEWIPDYFPNPIYDGFPVAFLEYQEANDYCQWRGMRLPTEAEWERAARGNALEPFYPWGTIEPDCTMANYATDGIFCDGGPRPVGSFPNNVSPYGVMEMGGNVWEWTSDWYAADYYSSSPCENPKGPETGTEKVLRGGAWYYERDALSVTYRNTWTPEFEFVGNMFGDYRGFGVRCVISDPDIPCDAERNVCDLPAGCGDVSAGSETEGSDGEEGEGGEGEQIDPDIQEQPIDSDDVVTPGDGEDVQHFSDSDVSVADSDTLHDEEDAPEEDVADSHEDADEPCVIPQEADIPDIFLCYDPLPGICPSGWSQGCEVKACHCSIGATVAPGNCGEDVMSVTAGWRTYGKNFTPFSPTEEMEVCEGFQGGVHLAAVFKVDAPQMQGEFFYADLYATMKIGDVIVGSYEEENTKLERGDDNLFISKLEQVRFEGCLGDAYDGEKVLLEILVRDQDGAWGDGQVEIPMVNKVEGPFLDNAFSNPC